MFVKRKYQKTLESLFSRPVSANIKWRDIESLLAALGSEVAEQEGSRIEEPLAKLLNSSFRRRPESRKSTTCKSKHMDSG